MKFSIENKPGSHVDWNLDIEFDSFDSIEVLLKGLYLLQNENKLFLQYLAEVAERYGEETSDSILELLSDHYEDTKNSILETVGSNISIINPVKIDKS